MSERFFVGLISGTSIDGIDAALIAVQNTQHRIIKTYAHTIPAPLRQQLHSLCQPGPNEIERMGEADTLLGREFASAAKLLLKSANIPAKRISAIGSHGQTIRHHAQGGAPYTVQIGDPNTIAEWTGITTVADFRRRDIAAGGQGAPLVPAFHRAVFASPHECRAVINIGGIANVTYLPPIGDTLGFDTGPGNTLMDLWVNRHLHEPFDRDGSWASTGKPVRRLLDALLDEPYLRLPAPKSTGRELFNAEWLDQYIKPTYSPSDVQATLLELTATTIEKALRQLPVEPAHTYICGGGALNGVLMQRLRERLPCPVDTTAILGIDPQWVEAAAFAWLAKATIDGQAGNVQSVTGALNPVILGGIYRGHL